MFPFFNVATSSIGYTPALEALYGPEPRVNAYYIDPVTNEMTTVNGVFGVAISYDPTTHIIFVDHGGLYSGVIKLS